MLVLSVILADRRTGERVPHCQCAMLVFVSNSIPEFGGRKLLPKQTLYRTDNPADVDTFFQLLQLVNSRYAKKSDTIFA
jgi:hypothetical protein